MNRRQQSGQVTVFVAIFMVALIGLAGLVIDGGVALAARRRALNEAQAAARAGAEALDADLYRRTGERRIDQDAARANVSEYMARADPGASYSVSFPAADSVSVDEQFEQSLNILGVFGVSSITARGSGSARTVHGISEENG